MIQTLADLEVKYETLIPIHCDNTSCWHVYKQVCLSLMARSEYAAMAKQGQCKLRRDSAECKCMCVCH
jgi:hypothetical protein